MAATRIGVFGGTFDPPHHGHLIVASEAFESLHLDRLLFIPAADPPHKGGRVRTPPEQRLRLLAAAIAGDPRFDLDDLEIRRGGTSYTVDTLRELRRKAPEARLFFLLGIDQYRQLDGWREPREVARLATLAVFARGGETPDLTGPYGGVYVPVSRIDISSTAIRKRARAGHSIRYFVPERVREIVEAEQIYRNDESRA